MSSALDIFPRMKQRAGINLPSWELPHIYRQPPSSIWTRKKERVEFGDVSYNIREDESRINDAIINYAKGVNPSVNTEYQNRKQILTSMTQYEASNPYKVNKSFRMPLFRQEDLLPLSRQKHPYTTVTTNPGSWLVEDSCDPSKNIDMQTVKFVTDVFKPSQVYSTQLSSMFGVEPTNTFDQKSINPNPMTIQNHLANPSLANEEARHSLGSQDMGLQNTFNISLMSKASRDIQFNPESKVKELKYNVPLYSVTSTPSDLSNALMTTNIEKLSEVRDDTSYQAVATNPSNQFQTLVDSDMKLDRKTNYFDTVNNMTNNSGINHKKTLIPNIRVRDQKLRQIANYNNRS